MSMPLFVNFLHFIYILSDKTKFSSTIEKFSSSILDIARFFKDSARFPVPLSPDFFCDLFDQF